MNVVSAEYTNEQITPTNIAAIHLPKANTKLLVDEIVPISRNTIISISTYMTIALVSNKFEFIK